MTGGFQRISEYLTLTKKRLVKLETGCNRGYSPLAFRFRFTSHATPQSVHMACWQAHRIKRGTRVNRMKSPKTLLIAFALALMPAAAGATVSPASAVPAEAAPKETAAPLPQPGEATDGSIDTQPAAAVPDDGREWSSGAPSGSGRLCWLWRLVGNCLESKPEIQQSSKSGGANE